MSPIFEPARPGIIEGRPGSTPLQASDFVAYELFKGRQFKDEGRDFRLSLQALRTVPRHWGDWTLDDLLDGSSKAKLKRSELAKERLEQPDLGISREMK
jgi:hypothetical protein